MEGTDPRRDPDSLLTSFPVISDWTGERTDRRKVGSGKHLRARRQVPDSYVVLYPKVFLSVPLMFRGVT